VPTPALERVALDGGVDTALAALPAAPGVAQILGPDDRSLLVARAADVRKWVAAQLGRGRAPKKGQRPPIDLTPIARAVRYAEARGAFRQRLLYERIVGPLVPLQKRRDLRIPAWLHLDPTEPFPRLTVRAGGDPARLFGPFRDAGAANKARDALQRATRLRPCDFTFVPAADLALGLGCVYAQVETCAAPCLERSTAEAYRALAEGLASALAAPAARAGPIAEAIPPWVRRGDSRAVLVEPAGDALTLYPLAGGALLDERAVTVPAADREAAIAALEFTPPAEPRDDTPWLMAWRHAPRRGAEEIVLSAR
jgi:hypothetical protein